LAELTITGHAAPPMDLEVARNFLVALRIGALVGIDRERKEAAEPGRSFGGPFGDASSVRRCESACTFRLCKSSPRPSESVGCNQPPIGCGLR
jgi:hypothetical protein